MCDHFLVGVLYVVWFKKWLGIQMWHSQINIILCMIVYDYTYVYDIFDFAAKFLKAVFIQKT